MSFLIFSLSDYHFKTFISMRTALDQRNCIGIFQKEIPFSNDYLFISLHGKFESVPTGTKSNDRPLPFFF